MPHILYAAYRRHSAVYSWDLRANVDTPICIYRGTNPEGRTNQKMRFDIDPSGRWMSTGNQA
jgi:telomerase Cajal body protein 1